MDGSDRKLEHRPLCQWEDHLELALQLSSQEDVNLTKTGVAKSVVVVLGFPITPTSVFYLMMDPSKSILSP